MKRVLVLVAYMIVKSVMQIKKRSQTSFAALGIVVFVLSGCNIGELSDDGGSSGSTDSSDDSDNSDSADSSGSLDSSVVSQESENSTDTNDAETNACELQCNLLDPNSCGPEKMCTSWVCEPGQVAWDSSVCGPIGEKQKGEECVDSWLGDASNTCAKGLTCFANKCVDTCVGSLDTLDCPSSDELCIVDGAGFFAICLLSCDPLSNACSDEQPLCVPTFSGGEGFICAVKGEGADQNGYGSLCQYSNSCPPGLLCVLNGTVDAPGCEDKSCCTNYCDTTLGDEQCLGDKEVCSALFDFPVPGKETVGACLVPEFPNGSRKIGVEI